MHIQVNTDDHIQGGESLATGVASTVESALGRFSSHVTRVEVHMSDENASKGGLHDKRCMMEARMEGRKPVAVVETAATMKHAVQGACDKLASMLDTQIDKLQDHRRNLPGSRLSEQDSST